MRLSNRRSVVRRSMGGWIFLILLAFVLSPAVHAENREAGFNELVIMEPGTHQDGLPAVIYDDETRQIDVPPALHIHRYYYTGDKEYQGPLIAGGPTIVVANHPKTLEKMYVDVMLPSGAPEIAYTKHCITYIYPDKRVVIYFSYLLPKHVKVAILHGRGIGRTFRKGIKNIAAHQKEQHQKSRFVGSLKEAIVIPVDVTKGAIGASQAAAGFVVDKAGQATNLIPGVQALKSMGEQSTIRGAQEEVRQAGLETADNARKFVRTIR